MKKMTIFLISFLVLGACAHKHGEPGQEHGYGNKKGAMNKKFLAPDMDPKHWKKRFEGSHRDVYRNQKQIIEELNIKPGQSIADVGAGTGAFLEQLNKKVGAQGKVYAVDISPKFVEFMNRRKEDEKLKSVEVVLGKLKTTTLPTGSVDKAMLVDVYHHLDNPDPMLKDFKRILKSEGELVVIDFNKVPGQSRQWILDHMRLTEKGYIDEITAAGFKFIEKKKIPFEENFMLVFKKL